MCYWKYLCIFDIHFFESQGCILTRQSRLHDIQPPGTSTSLQSKLIDFLNFEDEHQDEI